MNESVASRLEKYTIARPQEVLIVTAEVDGQPDQVLIFKGFSSSLMRSTAFDPDVPILPSEAIINGIDRLKSPYNPDVPHYIQQGLTWETMEPLLREVGV